MERLHMFTLTSKFSRKSSHNLSLSHSLSPIGCPLTFNALYFVIGRLTKSFDMVLCENLIEPYQKRKMKEALSFLF